MPQTPGTIRVPLAERLWAKVEWSEDGCWVWQGAVTSAGYGSIKVGGCMRGAHVVAYELSGEVIPEGMQLDHLCENKRCVRPSHLEVVTQQENIQRYYDRNVPEFCVKGHRYCAFPVGAVRYCHKCKTISGKARYRRRMKED